MKDWNPKLWLRILLPTVLIVAWLAIAGVGGPTFGKISSVSTNDQAGFLPASADSTAVNQWQTKFYDSTSIPAVVVSVKQSGTLTEADKAKFVALSPSIKSSPGVANLPDAAFLPTFSKDGKAAEYFVPFSVSGTKLTEDIASLRTVVADKFPSGFNSYVTGPGGLLADFVKGFAGIDGILLLVALLAVFVILLVVYRSILLPILVLLTSVFALSAAILGIYWLALNDIIKVSGQSQGILSILVIGAATDYSLLFVSRYREALFEVQSKWAAIARAYRGSFEAIAFSALTVILALLCLLFSDLNSNKALGPISAFGIFFAFLAAISFLPALLAAFGRAAFWPFMPKVGKKKVAPESAEKIAGLEGSRGLWRKVGTLISKRPRATWVITLIVLLAAVAALPTLKANGLPQTDLLLGNNIQSVEGQKVLGEHFDAGTGSPVVIIAKDTNYPEVEKIASGTTGVSTVSVLPDADKTKAAYEAAMKKAVAEAMATHKPLVVPTVTPVAKVVDGHVLINATLAYQADSAEAEGVVRTLRTEFADANTGALVGGTTAIALDTNVTAQADLMKIIPIVLLVIFIILMLLLRSIVAPLILIGTVVVSYAATLGVSALVFNNLFKFPGADASVPLFGFVFLVALGIDYNIFLMTRVREESLKIGTRPGILRGLTVTGGVITSAGVVLAATFAALGVIPILFLVQIAFIVAFGVILDTVVVRSLLVPALSYDIGRAIWWPSKLAKRD